MKKKLLGAAVVIGILALAQYIPRNLSENLGSGALPGACTIGDVAFRTDAAAGLNVFGCTALNTWTLLGDGSGGAATSTGADVAKPGTCTDGDVYFPDDGVYLRRCDTNVWVPWGPFYPMSDPGLVAL